jgi:hypothetical protein
MAANGISTKTGADPVATKLLRRTAKLDLAKAKRSDSSKPGYRPLHTITGSHTAYVGTATTTVSGSASPVVGHPWA